MTALAHAAEGIGETFAPRGVRVAIYVRISSNPSGDRLGVERQKPQCLAICADLGWTVVEVYVDNDVSASSGVERPAYERMLTDIRNGLIDAVVVLRVERLVRDHVERNDARDFIRFAVEHHLRFATAAGTINLSKSDGRKRFESEAVEAAYEVGKSGERLVEKHQELADKGKYSGGPPGYGYRPENGVLAINKAQKALILEAVPLVLADTPVPLLTICRRWNGKGIPTPDAGKWTARALKRGSLNDDPVFRATVPEADQGRVREAVELGEKDVLAAIARDLNARGILNPSAGKWTVPVLKSILVSPRIAGHRSHHGEISKRDAWPAIVDQVTHERLVDRLTDQDRIGRPRGGGRSYMLTGDRFEKLAVCGAPRADGTGPCWGPMIGSRRTNRKTGEKQRVYHCTDCGKQRVADPVEELIRDAFFAVYDAIEICELLAKVAGGDSREGELLKDLEEYDARLKLLRKKAGDKDSRFDDADFDVAKAEIEAGKRETRRELTRLRQPLRDLAAFPQRGEELRDAWAANDVAWRHAAVKTVVRYVVILPVGRGGPPRRFDPSRIKIVWKETAATVVGVDTLTDIWSRLAPPPPAPEHGLPGYRQGCRCEVCTAAHSEAGRRYYLANRERIIAQNREYERRRRDDPETRAAELARKRKANRRRREHRAAKRQHP